MLVVLVDWVENVERSKIQSTILMCEIQLYVAILFLQLFVFGNTRCLRTTHKKTIGVVSVSRRRFWEKTIMLRPKNTI